VKSPLLALLRPLLAFALLLAAHEAVAIPTVSMSSPTANQNFGAPARITLTATGTPSSGTTISKVEFFRSGTTLIGTVTSSPYTFAWTNVAIGNYSLTAKATDNVGGTKTSTAVAVTVKTNVVPSVSITSPAANANFGAPATITITATASDTDGTVSQVDFFRGGTTLIGTVTTSPFTFVWTNVAAASYSLTAKATDNSGGTKTSTAVAITVKTNVVPSVSITSPAANASFGSGAPVTINATASDTDGTVSQVEFFSGAASLGVGTTSPYSATFTPAAPGSYSLTAKATDNSGGTKTSTAIAITVLAPPTVNMTSPANNAAFTPPATIALAATATPASGATISKVEFFNGATLITSKTTSPYTFSWTNVAAGSYVLTAKATDSKGGTTISIPVNVTVAVPHQPPTVSITAPGSGSVSQAPATIAIAATAAAATGSTITKVDFFNASTLIGTAIAAPYTFNWTNVASGGYLLSAKATDSVGVATTSSLVYAIVDGADSCTNSPPISAAETATKFAAYGNLPLAFEENVGQSDARVKFLGHAPGYQLFLTGDSSVLALRSNEGRQAAMRISFADGNKAAAVTGIERQPNTTNYLVGSDASSWRSNIANYAKVRYASVYPGIDAIYQAAQGKLEYNLVVAPHADASRIRLAFDGVDALSIDESGALILRTPAGEIAQWKPVAYQQLEGARKEVRASYRLVGGNRVAFDLAAYDRNQTLVIDPVLVYSTYLGGSDSASGASAIALSRCGEAFVSGWTWATTFPTTPGAFDPSGDPASRMGFVSKLNQSGTGLLYSTYVTGIHFSTGNGDIAQNTDLVSIAVDSTGHAYVAGSTNSSDFPVTPGAMFTTPPSDPTAVLAKLSTDGSALLYATYMDLPAIAGVVVDSSGNAYVTGARAARKISANGASILYSFTVGGSGGVGGTDSASAIAVDATGNAYVTGTTHSNNPGTLPVTAGALETTWPATSTSSTSGFVQKINPAGTALVYGTYFGSRGDVRPTSIVVDSSGRVFLAGLSDGQGFPVTLGASHMFNMDLDRTGNMYAFASRLSADGSHLDFYSWVGGELCPTSSCSAAQTRANGIAIDSLSNVWITGITGSNRIPLTKPLYSNFAASGGDNFVVKLDPTGTSMLFGTLLNGTTVGTPSSHGNIDSNASGIQVDSIGSAYVSGWTNKLDFPTTAGAYQTVPRSNFISNAFVTKINETKDTTTALAVSPNPGNVGSPVTLTATVTGNAPTGTVTFFDTGVSVGSVALSGTTAQLVTSTLAGGVHSLTASYGGDAHNNSSASTVVQLNVASPNTPPTISLTGVVDGATLVTNSGSVYHGLTVTATGNAAPGNTLTSLTIWFGNGGLTWNETLNTSVNQPWTLPDLAPNVYTIYAILTDANNHSTSTSPIRFIVNSTGAAAPSITMTAPTNGAILQAPGPFTLSATATPGGAAISSVAYYAGTVVIGSSGAAPFSAQWNNAAAGSYSLIARATDVAGAMKLSVPISVTVTSPPPPTVALTSPANGANYFTTDVIPFAANATGNGGATIAKVEFYADGLLQGTAGSTSPYTYPWTTATAGTHSLTAIAYDSRNLTATTAPVSITVTVPPAPTVSITSPANGASFASPATVAINVNAVGGTGASVTRVDYYSGSDLIGFSTASPWTFTWTNVGPGTYSLTAKVTDSNAGTGTSSPVSVTVTQGALAITADAGFDGSTVSDGAVTVTGTIQAPPNSSVTVSGTSGMVLADGRFYVNGVPLSTGANALTLAVTDPDGNTTSQNISVNSGGPGLFKVTVTPTDGIAPLAVAFSVKNPSNTPFTSIEFDINGDGITDYTASDLASANPIFTMSAGYTVAKVTVQNGSTIVYTFKQPIYVYTPIDRYNVVKGALSNVLNRLKAGNGDSAGNLFVESRRDEYKALFASMGASLASIASQLGTIRGGSFAGDFAELIIVRNTSSGTVAYPIHLVRDPDGVWRIEGM
jgi:hypothetical protein